VERRGRCEHQALSLPSLCPSSSYFGLLVSLLSPLSVRTLKGGIRPFDNSQSEKREKERERGET